MIWHGRCRASKSSRLLSFLGSTSLWSQSAVTAVRFLAVLASEAQHLERIASPEVRGDFGTRPSFQAGPGRGQGPRHLAGGAETHTRTSAEAVPAPS